MAADVVAPARGADGARRRPRRARRNGERDDAIEDVRLDVLVADSVERVRRRAPARTFVAVASSRRSSAGRPRGSPAQSSTCSRTPSPGARRTSRSRSRSPTAASPSATTAPASRTRMPSGCSTASTGRRARADGRAPGSGSRSCARWPTPTAARRPSSGRTAAAHGSASTCPSRRASQRVLRSGSGASHARPVPWDVVRPGDERRTVNIRTGTLAAALVVLLLAVAAVASGCGSTSADDGVAALDDAAATTSEDDESTASNSDDDDDPQEVALAWAKCMREHGIDVPDPRGRRERPRPGHVQGRQAPRGRTATTLREGARGVRHAVRRRRPAAALRGGARGDAGDDARVRHVHARARRRHARPRLLGRRRPLRRRRPGSGIDPESATFQKAQEACQDIIEDAMAAGGRGCASAAAGRRRRPRERRRGRS